MVTAVKKLGDADFEVETDGGLTFRSKVVVIAAGGGCVPAEEAADPRDRGL